MPHTSENRTDVLVVGAGAIGLACAWRAAQRGLSVRVLERSTPGSGASGVAAGMLAPVGEATWGEERILAMAQASHARWAGFAHELALESKRDIGYLDSGALHVALDADEVGELGRRFELMQELGLEASWLRGREARELEPGVTPRCVGAVRAPHEAAVDARAFVSALRVAAEAAGAEVQTATEVTEGLLGEGRIEGVRTDNRHEHRAANVVLAAGAWSGEARWLPPEARPPVRPVKGEILTLRGRPGELPCRGTVVSEWVYVVPRSDGRLVVGATVGEQGFDTAVTAGAVLELLREGYRTLPDLVELELAEMMAGLRPGTPDNAPIVGRGTIDGLILATGHYRNGILLTPVTADAVVSLLEGDEPPPELEVARPDRFPVPSEVGAR